MKDATRQTKCKTCGGTGRVKQDGREVKCIACRGTGKAAGYNTK